MKPRESAVFQFRAGFSFETSVDDLWMALNIVDRSAERPDSPQQKPVFKSCYPRVRHSVGP